MTAVRTHIYSVDPANLDELIVRRGALIAAVRAKHPGLSDTRLIALEDGTYSDTWHWDSVEQLVAALRDIPNLPEAPLAMSLTQNATAQNGRVID
ncbi:hypothetical protein [Nonomuraea sediminis]|uniref:hypothetical protein n=1 Tax=Nonomuraea sediminis TaxID=2835864 RepID=UPI001BDCBEF5|nr:hypothetical protein [Nonomuraea sediminis]